MFVLRSRSKEEEAEEIGHLIIRLQGAAIRSCFPLALLYRINSQSLAARNRIPEARTFPSAS